MTRDERGQVSLLVIGFFLVVLLTVAVAVDASAAYLRRQGLDSLADATALAAADGVRAEQAYAGDDARVDPEVARRYAADYLRRVRAAATYDGLALAVSVAGDRVVVRLSALVRLPIAPPDWEDQPTVTGEAAAFVLTGR